MGLFSREKRVLVECVNSRDNSRITTLFLSPDELPETFRINTTLTIHDDEWSVTDATPTDKKDFLKTRRLRLTLSKIGYIELKPGQNILFSLPTVSNDCGTLEGDTPPHEGLFAILEDDWRQQEFVAERFRQEIDDELVDIRRIWENERTESGAFRKTHLRKRIPDPLMGISMTVSELQQTLKPAKVYDAVSIFREAGTFRASFAWSVDRTLVVWGVTREDETVAILCLSGEPEEATIPSVSRGLAEVAARYGLLFVDWWHVARISADAQAFERYFRLMLERHRP